MMGLVSLQEETSESFLSVCLSLCRVRPREERGHPKAKSPHQNLAMPAPDLQASASTAVKRYMGTIKLPACSALLWHTEQTGSKWGAGWVRTSGRGLPGSPEFLT